MTHDGSKFNKLDHFLLSHRFSKIWHNSSVIALIKHHSDHCPLFLNSNCLDFGPIPFKIFNSWLTDPSLECLVKDNWGNKLVRFNVFSKIERLSRKLRHLKSEIREWRRKVVGWIMKLLKNKIVAIDTIVEVVQIDAQLIKDKEDFMHKIQEIDMSRLMDLR